MSPGFMDAHSHLTMIMSYGEGAATDQWYHAINGAAMGRIYLSRGFTTVRDAGGNSYSIKKAFDKGMFPGPRVYPSGPMISQSGGHADHRSSANPRG